MIDDASERLLGDEEMLAALGYEPVGFTRADDALAACRAIPKRFDALLVGHRASAVSALDLAVALHEIVPEVPIVLATASADESGADALVAAGDLRGCAPAPYLCRDRRGFGALPDGFGDSGRLTTTVTRFSRIEITP